MYLKSHISVLNRSMCIYIDVTLHTFLIPVISALEGRKEMFYLTTHSTHLIYGYMESDIIMVKDHSDSERENPLSPHGLLFPFSSKGSFICIIPQTR